MANSIGLSYESITHIRGAKAPTAQSVKSTNKHVHALMDRVCEQCHNFYSHIYPNMRHDCSLNCYNNEDFRKCLHLFEPPTSSELAEDDGENKSLDEELLKALPVSISSALKIRSQPANT